MKKFIAIGVLLLGVTAIAMATPPTPEIDPATGGSALALLAGALVIFQGRRRR